MVLCVIALVVFGVLGIFSVRHRKVAAEAFDCVTRMVTLRPCTTKLDERIKAKVVAKAFKRSPGAAALLNRHFEAFSWAFLILTFASFGYTAYGAYNLITIGTCDPISGACVFSQIGGNITESHCASTTFIEFYGTECAHCRGMDPVVAQVEEETGVLFEKLEVYHNDSNMALLLEYAPHIERDCGILGTPAFFSTKTNRSICGAMPATRLKLFVMENG